MNPQTATGVRKNKQTRFLASIVNNINFNLRAASYRIIWFQDNLKSAIMIRSTPTRHQKSGANIRIAQYRNWFDQPVEKRGTMLNDDDELLFLAENEDADETLQEQLPPWLIMIADDDHAVHETTLLALRGVRIHERPLAFVHAYSAHEAQDLIGQNPDIALILLDVVMETVDAGLRLVRTLRDDMALSKLRIVLRTGQPGYAPELDVSQHYAIDGYTTKSKLTRFLLVSVLSDTLSNSVSSERPN